MMGTFQILANPTPAQVNANSVTYLVPPANSTTQYVSEALTLSSHQGLSGFAYICKHLGLV
jgi:hypothetical protein